MKSEFRLSPAFCLYNGIAVRNRSGRTLRLIAEHPEDEALRNRMEKAFMQFLRLVEGSGAGECDSSKPEIIMEKGTHDEIRTLISHLYGTDEEDSEKNEMSAPEKEEACNSAAELLLETLLRNARKAAATDIHLEKCMVRFRVNGMLTPVMVINQKTAGELVRRIKMLAHMNILEKKRSQDGQFVYGTNDPIFVRVSCMSIVGDGTANDEESVVLRLLDSKRTPLSVSSLGFNTRQLAVLENLERQQNGLILVCGPTGAGKSTTAASLLIDIQQRSGNKKKIISIEDPPEYVLQGVTQIRADQSGENGFIPALVKLFRQDPDVLFIGEIRDLETAHVAVQAALTGHLVFATLHTSDAACSVIRMKDLGADPHMLVSVLRGVIAQQLDYTGDRPELIADVAVPKNNLAAVAESCIVDEIDTEFSHCTNVLTHILDTLKRLPPSPWQKKLPEITAGAGQRI